jgi:hypothetical protein
MGLEGLMAQHGHRPSQEGEEKESAAAPAFSRYVGFGLLHDVCAKHIRNRAKANTELIIPESLPSFVLSSSPPAALRQSRPNPMKAIQDKILL